MLAAGLVLANWDCWVETVLVGLFDFLVFCFFDFAGAGGGASESYSLIASFHHMVELATPLTLHLPSHLLSSSLYTLDSP